MDLDKNWFRGGVAADVYDDLRRKENHLITFAEYNGSKHLSGQRRRIIDWMLEVNRSSEKTHSDRHHNCRNHHSMMLNTRSVHLAVYLFDYFLHHNSAHAEHVWLIAATSMIVAAKFEVQHSCVPSPKIMNQHIQIIARRSYSFRDFIHVEWKLLKCVEWRLHVPLSVDFLQYYETSFEILDNHRYSSPDSILSVYSTPAHGMCTPSPEPSIIVDDWKNTADFLINYSLKDLAFRDFKPSTIAGAAVAAARWYHRLKPYWTKKLTDISGYDFDGLNPCLNYFVKTCFRRIERERHLNPSAFTSPLFDLNTAGVPSNSFYATNPPPVRLPVSSPPIRLPTPTISPDLEYSATVNYSSPSLSAAVMNTISAQSMTMQFGTTMNAVPARQFVGYTGSVDASSIIGQRPQIGHRLPPIHVPQTTQNVSYGCFSNGTYATMVPRETLLIPAVGGAVYHTNAVPVFHIIGTLAQTDNGRIVYLIKNNIGYCQSQTAVVPAHHQTAVVPAVAAAPLRTVEMAPSSNYEMINYETNTIRQQQQGMSGGCHQRIGSNCYQSYSNETSSSTITAPDVSASNHNYEKLIGPYTRSMKRSLGVAGSEILTELEHTTTKRIRRK